MEIYGYACANTREQNGGRQLIALREISIPERNIFMDKQRGRNLVGTFLADIVLQVLSTFRCRAGSYKKSAIL